MPDGPVSLRAPAKANLFLRVLAREASGYHSIETLFCPLDLSDDLTAEIRPGKAVSIEVLGADVGPAEDNLAVRAAELVLQATGHRFGVHLTLHKRIRRRQDLAAVRATPPRRSSSAISWRGTPFPGTNSCSSPPASAVTSRFS